jgi:hypothetical protein
MPFLMIAMVTNKNLKMPVQNLKSIIGETK